MTCEEMRERRMAPPIRLSGRGSSGWRTCGRVESGPCARTWDSVRRAHAGATSRYEREPGFRSPGRSSADWRSLDDVLFGDDIAAPRAAVTAFAQHRLALNRRSEERRVGKECRSRW